ncbi:MAG: UDP-N-acetylmuramoyl-L-alanyl-D-glutamate--2,6-diaminopimelate ligase [Oxalicibacterium faecigallinarum]|uniref:UDP-N-acetylmuramoyl-L-alanyl-D-glutamate--2, 6-diaminopimelate ligase n=1 Tax=Oxalicibacterium faecigallinarum TaxID=573741 RepID=UPI0028097E56|nr:UDP-N-acetylmuramoyl-L-alanyl-D-glutamate--2,6-diaminopimelate ligase [Oxalicibacterium faecigallinarum]MDQ7969978.1 UDP-N-acetylmuramoyl-L-alanyl-D-glutamate--2,6-diaminopimelate ligase [Oxalicibacterium faecigallinarum]
MAAHMNLDVILDWLRQHAPKAQLTADSRKVQAGDVFVAYPNDEADGRAYIGDAVERGAIAILLEADGGADFTAAIAGLPSLPVAHLKSQVGEIAAAWYAHPDRAMLTVAVTGTNGKTSCSQWLGSALSRLGRPTAVIGTLGTGIYRDGTAGTFTVTGYTTPDAVQLQRALAELGKHGATALAIEASSIGLHQQRMAGMHVDIALFTNFTRDHLDYHGDMQAYEEAKTQLFDWPGLKHAVINVDDAMGERLIARLRSTRPEIAVTAYSIGGHVLHDVATLQATDVRSSQSGTAFHLHFGAERAQVKTQLVGDFNVSNVLGIIGVLLAQGAAWREAIAAVEALTAVPGRMQQLGGIEAPLVVIDYAHTPDALKKALASLRLVAEERHGKLWCVFGCGGDRDPGKRPQMGAVAMVADHVIVTTDNPRYEEPESIIAQIVAGIDKTHADMHVIEDRATAILWACRNATRQDVILLAGKGHENCQEIKGRKLPFLDADHAALALSSRAMQGAHG